jgi:hypothetical protein
MKPIDALYLTHLNKSLVPVNETLSPCEQAIARIVQVQLPQSPEEIKLDHFEQGASEIAKLDSRQYSFDRDRVTNHLLGAEVCNFNAHLFPILRRDPKLLESLFVHDDDDFVYMQSPKYPQAERELVLCLKEIYELLGETRYQNFYKAYPALALPKARVEGYERRLKKQDQLEKEIYRLSKVLVRPEITVAIAEKAKKLIQEKDASFMDGLQNVGKLTLDDPYVTMHDDATLKIIDHSGHELSLHASTLISFPEGTASYVHLISRFERLLKKTLLQDKCGGQTAISPKTANHIVARFSPITEPLLGSDHLSLQFYREDLFPSGLTGILSLPGAYLALDDYKKEASVSDWENIRLHLSGGMHATCAEVTEDMITHYDTLGSYTKVHPREKSQSVPQQIAQIFKDYTISVLVSEEMQEKLCHRKINHIRTAFQSYLQAERQNAKDLLENYGFPTLTLKESSLSDLFGLDQKIRSSVSSFVYKHKEIHTPLLTNYTEFAKLCMEIEGGPAIGSPHINVAQELLREAKEASLDPEVGQCHPVADKIMESEEFDQVYNHYYQKKLLPDTEDCVTTGYLIFAALYKRSIAREQLLRSAFDLKLSMEETTALLNRSSLFSQQEKKNFIDEILQQKQKWVNDFKHCCN